MKQIRNNKKSDEAVVLTFDVHNETQHILACWFTFVISFIRSNVNSTHCHQSEGNKF